MANIGSITMLYNFTRDGMVGVKKMGGKVVASTTKFLKDFTITVSTVLCFSPFLKPRLKFTKLTLPSSDYRRAFETESVISDHETRTLKI